MLDDLALALWCVAMASLIPLAISEAIRPRLHYDLLRWATVFPVGMYAACSFAVGQVTGLGGITDFARIWTPIALGVTLLALVGLTRRILLGRSHFVNGQKRGRGRQGRKIMTALGSNAHLFARPHRRQELTWCFETALGCPVATVEFPGMAESMLVIRFPDGGSLSIEFTEEAPDDDQPRLGAWLELRAEDPAAAMRAAMDAGFKEVKHPGHPYYFMAPGGQVFTIAPLH